MANDKVTTPNTSIMSKKTSDVQTRKSINIIIVYLVV